MIAVALLLAGGQMLGMEGASCAGGHGPALRVAVTGLKDRRGNLKLELYPDNERDWLKDDRVLLPAGKVFRRTQVRTPSAGAVELCIRAPHPGRYALLFTHDRDGKNKFSLWQDGMGVPSNVGIGRTKPKHVRAIVDVGAGGAAVTIRAQYLRGLGGFGPVG